MDANIFMYAAGVEHPHKVPSAGFLLRIAQGEVDAAVDAEALQEILHRYRAMGQWADGRRVYESARRIVPITLPITCELIDAARDLLESHAGLTVRDAIHAAVALHSGADAICSYDRDFDGVAGLRRVEP
ncbi:MAG TPA: type II toxin-antitoxin system VapC family toxin [Thermoanaerobaculia bacterium]